MWESFAQLVVLRAAYQAIAQQATTPYPNMAPIDQYFMTDQGPEYPWRDVWRRATLHAMRRSWFLGVNGFETAVILMDYYNSTIAIQYSTSTATMGFYAWGKILLRPPAEVLAYQCHPPAKFSISTHSFLPRMVHTKGIFLSPLACPALRRATRQWPLFAKSFISS
jgi:hypothetical protein